MSDNSKIEWTDATWNPIAGCSKVSPGCRNCYAILQVRRMGENPNPKVREAYQGMTACGNGRLDWTGGIRLLPSRLATPHHWTKPTRVFVNSLSDLFHDDVPEGYIQKVFEVMRSTPRHTYQVLTKRSGRLLRVSPRLAWPGNVWQGVSVESAAYASRIDDLRRTGAAVKFLSLEPLLGPLPDLDLTGINWVIVGGESGPGARRMDPAWARDLRDECAKAGVPFFFKQWGAFNEAGERVGKKKAGRTLDGRTYDGYPAEAGSAF